MTHEQKLKEMGLSIEPVNLEFGKYVQGVRVGSLVFTSGQISAWNGKEIKGKVGLDVTVEQAYEAARFCALNNLRVVKALTGSVDDIKRVVKVLGMVNAAPGFDNTPAVINGCSDLLREVFGDSGKHARSAVGMTIPLNWAVEVEMVFEMR